MPMIVALVHNKANARLLDRFLGERYRLSFELSDDTSETPALIILDTASLELNRNRLHELRAQHEPVVLPVMVISDSQDGPASITHKDLGLTVDDILRIPTSQAELFSRIKNLLRLQYLSQEQETARQHLSSVVGTLKTLNNCDKILVRATDEEVLLEALCQTIVDTDRYQLAWVGFVSEESQGPPHIRAYAGPARSFTETLVSEWAKADEFSGTVGRALKTGVAQVARSLRDEPGSEELHATADSHGLESAIVLPLNTTIGLAGYLAVYSRTASQFGPEEAQLLQHLAANTTYALNALRFQRERDLQSAEIHSLAFSDPLTGLPNRRYLIDNLNETLAFHEPEASRSCAILFVDLDGFKVINDALGHDSGDQVLRQVGLRLQSSVRDSDLVIRQGGDEFIIVMLDAPRNKGNKTPSNTEDLIDQAYNLSRRIIDHLHEPISISEVNHRLSASIGISLFPQHGRMASSVIQAADTAMYEAKRKGGGCSHIYTASISEKRQHRLSLESRLRQAIEQDGLSLDFQPIFELESSRLIAAEALVRWPQPDGKTLMPGDFIPMAEETGLITALGDWVLEHSAYQLQQWQAQGQMLGMAVNLSVRQIYPHGDIARIIDLVRPYVNPRWITLEITESTLIVEPSVVEPLLQELNDEGFQIAIDDFGTGYSSLSRLQQVPIQTLKIDRSFVSRMNKADNEVNMIPIIQKMAASFGLSTVAEGIENESQFIALRNAGVDYGQGFWLARPMSAKKFESYFISRSR